MTKVVNKDKAVGAVANQITHVVLQYFAFQFTYVKKNNDYLKTVDGWLDFSIAITFAVLNESFALLNRSNAFSH